MHASVRTPAFMYIEKAPFCVLDITNMQLTSHVGELREIEDNGREGNHTLEVSRCRTVGPNCKNPPKMRFKNFVKLTGYTHSCNSLTNFEYEAHILNGNGNYVNLLKLTWKSQ